MLFIFGHFCPYMVTFTFTHLYVYTHLHQQTENAGRKICHDKLKNHFLNIVVNLTAVIRRIAIKIKLLSTLLSNVLT